MWLFLSVCKIYMIWFLSDEKKGSRSASTNGKLTRTNVLNAKELFWFSLVTWFNGISTFVGYLMLKLFMLKNSIAKGVILKKINISFIILFWLSVVTQQNVTEWEITKTVGNEMEIFITLAKYNTRQWREEGKLLLMVTTWWAYFHPFTVVSNIFMRNGTYPLMFIGKIYNIW